MMQEITAYQCQDCNEVSDTCEDEPLYECGSCGSRFMRSNSADGDSHRCPNDNKFGSKIADQTCVSCQEGEVEEVTGFQCEICGHIEVTDTEPDKCSECEEEKMKEKELKKLKSLPIDQRGGQKVFSTKEEALAAFSEFLGAVKSEHISLVPVEDYETKDKSGVRWETEPKPTVNFHFEPEAHYNDPYIEEARGAFLNLSDRFYEDVEEAALKYLKGKPHWNNMRSTGWIGHYGDNG